MGRYEFKVVVTGVELSKEQETHVGRAVAQAGASTIASVLGGNPISVPVDLRHWWCGPYPPAMQRELESEARRLVAEGVHTA